MTRTTKPQRVAAARQLAIDSQPHPLPAVDSVLRSVRESAAMDCESLAKSAIKAHGLLRGGDPGGAAQVLRAWAGMALAIVSRVEYSQAYAAGAAAAMDKD